VTTTETAFILKTIYDFLQRRKWMFMSPLWLPKWLPHFGGQLWARSWCQNRSEPVHTCCSHWLEHPPFRAVLRLQYFRSEPENCTKTSPRPVSHLELQLHSSFWRAEQCGQMFVSYCRRFDNGHEPGWLQLARRYNKCMDLKADRWTICQNSC
jgi:hypothetical protein